MSDTNEIFLRSARVTQTHLVVEMSDGRELATPLAWYPRLAQAATEDLADFEVSSDGVHWEKLDEDLSLEGMLAGRRGVGEAQMRSEPITTVPSFEALTTQTLVEIGRNNAGVDFPTLVDEIGR